MVYSTYAMLMTKPNFQNVQESYGIMMDVKLCALQLINII